MSKLNPTLGERRVGWYFEPSGNDVADGVKTQCAALIDLVSAYEENNIALAGAAQDAFKVGCEMFVSLLNNKK
jgi:hypothetical protein